MYYSTITSVDMHPPPPLLTYPVNFPLNTMRNPSLYMFQRDDPSYLIRLSARAT